MDVSNQKEFAASVEDSLLGSRDQKRLCIRRGNHTESLGINSEEAQQVMLVLLKAFPGPLSQLLEAGRPLSDILEDKYPAGTMFTLEVDAGDIGKLQDSILALDEIQAKIDVA